MYVYSGDIVRCDCDYFIRRGARRYKWLSDVPGIGEWVEIIGNGDVLELEEKYRSVRTVVLSLSDMDRYLPCIFNSRGSGKMPDINGSSMTRKNDDSIEIEWEVIGEGSERLVTKPLVVVPVVALAAVMFVLAVIVNLLFCVIAGVSLVALFGKTKVATRTVESLSIPCDSYMANRIEDTENYLYNELTRSEAVNRYKDIITIMESNATSDVKNETITKIINSFSDLDSQLAVKSDSDNDMARIIASRYDNMTGVIMPGATEEVDSL